MNIDGCNQKRLTNNDVDDWRPSWYNDGTQLFFGSNTNKDGDYGNGDWNIYIMNTDSSSVKKNITKGTKPAHGQKYINNINEDTL